MNINLTQFPILWIHLHNGLVETGDEHSAVVEFMERWYKGKVHIEDLFCLRLATTRMEAENIGGTSGYPNSSVISLFKVHRHKYRPLIEDIQFSACIATFHHNVAGREP